MSNSIHFSYIFNEAIERVYECFSNSTLVPEVTFANLVTNVKKIKGTNLNENGAKFRLTYKNYYTMELEVENSINTEIHKGFTHSTKKIDEIPDLIFSMIFNFYFNSCERRTVFTFDFTYSDPFFEQLIRDEISDEEKIQICKNVETYLKKTTKGLEQIESTVIKGPFLEVWDYISDWSKLFPACGDLLKVYAVYKGDCRFLGTQVDIYETEGKTLLGSLSIKNVMMSEDKMEMIFETVMIKQSVLPRQFVNIRLTKMNSDACFLSVIHIAQEYVSTEVLMVLSRFKKKVIGFVKEHFDKIYKERKNNKPK